MLTKTVAVLVSLFLPAGPAWANMAKAPVGGWRPATAAQVLALQSFIETDMLARAQTEQSTGLGSPFFAAMQWNPRSPADCQAAGAWIARLPMEQLLAAEQLPHHEY
ncbi:MAG: hypothetical protein PHF00_07925, partial [Elusimicrobia bacterium]|nr:hypothetical protein [Elusimicrobiota bacterium]